MEKVCQCEYHLGDRNALVARLKAVHEQNALHRQRFRFQEKLLAVQKQLIVDPLEAEEQSLLRRLDLLGRESA